MLSKEEVLALIENIHDPFLNATLKETGGILEIKINEEKKHVSLQLAIAKPNTAEQMDLQQQLVAILKRNGARTVGLRDRKSTRLNSSHVKISYAVFCLKKKKKITNV